MLQQRRQNSPMPGPDGGPNNTVIQEVIGSESPYLPAAVQVFRAIFPTYEHYAPYIYACALQTSYNHPGTFDHVWLVEQNGNPIGLRIFRYVPERDFGFDAFIGLLDGYHNQGIGTWLIEQTLKQLCMDAERFGRPEPSGCCAEVEPIQMARTEDQRQINEARVAFYRKQGGFLLDVDYIEPPMIRHVDYITEARLTGIQPKPKQLVFYPVRSRTSLTYDELVKVLDGIYLDVYRLEHDSWYMFRAVNSIRIGGKP
jgi:GNAT superfamily N-acetyltransferase